MKKEQEEEVVENINAVKSSSLSTLTILNSEDVQQMNLNLISKGQLVQLHCSFSHLFVDFPITKKVRDYEFPI